MIQWSKNNLDFFHENLAQSLGNESCRIKYSATRESQIKLQKAFSAAPNDLCVSLRSTFVLLAELTLRKQLRRISEP